MSKNKIFINGVSFKLIYSLNNILGLERIDIITKPGG